MQHTKRIDFIKFLSILSFCKLFLFSRLVDPLASGSVVRKFSCSIVKFTQENFSFRSFIVAVSICCVLRTRLSKHKQRGPTTFAVFETNPIHRYPHFSYHIITDRSNLLHIHACEWRQQITRYLFNTSRRNQSIFQNVSTSNKRSCRKESPCPVIADNISLLGVLAVKCGEWEWGRNWIRS